ncbi:MAG TPA: hypothetical protein VD694_05690 [Nitrososphaeraceae archaeon]|nr:hypothetical protein [Nitrososphaeraceae archaeon]
MCTIDEQCVFPSLGAPKYSDKLDVGRAALLMVVIVVVVYTRGLRGYGGLVIGGIVGLDIFFLAFISGNINGHQ